MKEYQYLMRDDLEKLRDKIKSQLRDNHDGLLVSQYFSCPSDLRAAQYVRSIGGNAADMVEYRKTMEAIVEDMIGGYLDG